MFIQKRALIIIDMQRGMSDPARSAGNLGFATVVIADATFAFEQRDFSGTLRSAQEVHLRSLANLDGEYATVRSTAEVLVEMNS